ncbi:OmpA/MotB family protein [Syntrophorhabdus aromaticivorans]|uniref:OmpA/MotB family protein n=1 Tax=Syntrophorhabdus aromaticivorans TaxID=328301 RepID=UPI000417B3D9|nr:OmpA family protein [Syntrophorhabdus aromaticivorans]
MRKKKHDEDHENAERWLLTYADLITLLLAFFIMMYVFSKRDAQKYEEVASHLRAIFTGGTGLAEKGSITASSPIEMASRGASSGDIKRQLESELLDMNRDKGGSKNISVLSDERGIVIRVLDKTFFDEGRADLKEGARAALDKIVPIIRKVNNHIRIEGHTDNVPINTQEFKSNWELSVRRATEVVRYLLEKHGLPPERISATGYAEYRPVADNDSPKSRALNRRIEIIITKSEDASE